MFIESIIRNAEQNNPPAEGDFIGSDGLLRCGVCGEPKQYIQNVKGKPMIVPVICGCVKKQLAEEKAEREAMQREARRERAFADPQTAEQTFAKDDDPQSERSRIARNYAAGFEPGTSRWLMFYGGTGAGKSFLAACIVNAVIDRGFTARFTSISEIERKLWNTNDKTAVYEDLNRCDFLVIDDLFSERDTEYMQEIVYNLIDTRYRSRRPMLITSNISAQEFAHPKDMSRQRIFSRISELAVPVLFQGADRRRERLKATMQGEYKKLLSGEPGNRGDSPLP